MFEHPEAGVQLPKGGLEEGEDPAVGVLREIEEETGVTGIVSLRSIGTWERHVGAGPSESGSAERHLWEVFLIDAPSGLPDEWFHSAWGSPEEDGLRFRCHWVQIDEHTHEKLHPLFAPVVEMLGDAVRS